MKLHLVLQRLAALAGLAAAAPSNAPEAELSELKERAATCNTPSNRACWTSNFNISTNYYNSWPTTGVVRPYTLVVTEAGNFVGGDGATKVGAMLINGTFPGPVISADWGDTIQVTVVNQLKNNGTSFHWHGVRQLNTNVQDGANGITECPIPPGHSKVYTFLATQYGTSWYHSHFSTQYGNGVVGTILIRGPASLPYDIDLGTYPITDWYYKPAEAIQYSLIPPPGAAPPSDNILFNGSHVNATGGGKYNVVTLTPGKRHLLRIINTSVENTFTVSLSNHTMTVVATDFVPVDSYTTNQIYLGVGQRYDVTIDASQATSNYWFNVTFSDTGLCGISNINKPASIFRYQGAPATNPTYPGVAPPESLCQDFTSYTPYVPLNVLQSNFSATSSDELNLTLITKPWDGVQRVYWNINGQDMNITWGDPTLMYVANGDTSQLPASYNVFQIPQENEWSYWIVNNGLGLPHPLHLHGHDFFVLGHSAALASPFSVAPSPFNPATDMSLLNFNNPTRRDVTMLPGSGWVALAFKSDNPGAWLLHCHIAWHVAQGLSVQFLERLQDIPGTVQLSDITANCNAWNSYYPTDTFKQFDSGLKARD